jgi:hypothetical protein
MHEPDILLLFLKPLNRLHSVYLVTGAAAAIVYGVPRLTNDLDLVLKISINQISQFRQAFSEKEFYVPPEEVFSMEISREQRGHLNLIHLATGFKADCYLAGKDPLHKWALENRSKISFHGEALWIAPPEYVILRKLEYYREGGSDKHLNDIKAIINVSKEKLNFNILEEKIAQLNLKEQWKLINISE